MIGENFQAEFDVTLGEGGFDCGCLELLGEGQDGGVNVAVAGQLTAQPLHLQTLRDGLMLRSPLHDPAPTVSARNDADAWGRSLTLTAPRSQPRQPARSRPHQFGLCQSAGANRETLSDTSR